MYYPYLVELRSNSKETAMGIQGSFVYEQAAGYSCNLN